MHVYMLWLTPDCTHDLTYIWFWYKISLLIHYAMLDTRWYIWHDWTSSSVTDCFIYCLIMLCLLFQSYFSIYYLHMLTRFMHMHLPLYFTHSLGPFLMTLDLHVQILDVLFYLIRCSMRLQILRGARIFLYPFWYSCLPSYSYCFCSFFDSMSLPVVIPFLIHMLSCVDAYMWYCSDIDLL